MNRGKGSLTRMRIGGQYGYTIVEVLIFLAVSAVLFASTMALLSGRQQRVHFTNVVRDFETKLTDVANDVSNGYYQSAGNVTCDNALTIGVSASKTQGTNNECIMLGRVIKFGYDTGGERFGIYSLVGRRQAAGKDVKNIGESGLALLWVSGANDDTKQSFREQRNVGFGASIRCVAVGNSCTPGGNNGALAFVTRLTGGAQPSASGGTIFADAYLYDQLALTASEDNFVAHVNSTTPVSLTQPLVICLRSGGTNQHALVKLMNGRVTSEIKEGAALCN